MLKYLAILPLPAILIGCSPKGTNIDDMQGAGKTPKEITYSCDRGGPVTVRFMPVERKAMLTYQGKQIELPGEPSGSGFKYSNAKMTIQGKGNNMTLTIGKMAPMQCTATPSQGK